MICLISRPNASKPAYRHLYIIFSTNFLRWTIKVPKSHSSVTFSLSMIQDYNDIILKVEKWLALLHFWVAKIVEVRSGSCLRYFVKIQVLSQFMRIIRRLLKRFQWKPSCFCDKNLQIRHFCRKNLFSFLRFVKGFQVLPSWSLVHCLHLTQNWILLVHSEAPKLQYGMTCVMNYSGVYSCL